MTVEFFQEWWDTLETTDKMIDEDGTMYDEFTRIAKKSAYEGPESYTEYL